MFSERSEYLKSVTRTFEMFQETKRSMIVMRSTHERSVSAPGRTRARKCDGHLVLDLDAAVLDGALVETLFTGSWQLERELAVRGTERVNGADKQRDASEQGHACPPRAIHAVERRNRR